MLKEEDLKAWFISQGVSTAMSEDVLPEAEPHRACAISVTGGLGLALEQAFDRPTFQLLVRGVNGKDARDLALEFDQVWLDAVPGFLLGDYWVTAKGRFGGPPAYVGKDQNERYPGRVLRAATYYAEIER